MSTRCFILSCVSLLLPGPCLLSQDSTSESETTPSDAAADNVDGWWISSLESNCTQCHQASHQFSQYNQLYTGQLAHYGLGNTLHSDGAIYFNFVGQQSAPAARLGGYMLGSLDNKILRGHLKLGELPALIVLQAANSADDTVLEVGDVVLKIDGEAVPPAAEVNQLIDSKEEELDISGIRAGDELKIRVSVAAFQPQKGPYRIGVHAEAPSEAIRSQLRLYENEGIIVSEVIADSPAHSAGIQVHDILLRADAQRLSGLDDLRAAVQDSDGAPLQITLMRGGSEQTLAVTPQREPAKEISHDVPAACPYFSQSQHASPNQFWHAFAPTELDDYRASTAAYRFLIQNQPEADDEEQDEQVDEDVGNGAGN